MRFNEICGQLVSVAYDRMARWCLLVAYTEKKEEIHNESNDA